MDTVRTLQLTVQSHGHINGISMNLNLVNIISKFGRVTVIIVMMSKISVLFKQEQRDLLLNPLKDVQKEVHPEEIAKQGRGAWMGVAMWFVAMVLI